MDSLHLTWKNFLNPINLAARFGRQRIPSLKYRELYQRQRTESAFSQSLRPSCGIGYHSNLEMPNHLPHSRNS